MSSTTHFMTSRISKLLFLCILLIALGTAVIPILVKHVTKEALLHLGLERVSIGQVGVSLFKGSIRVENLLAQKNDRKQIEAGKILLAINWQALLTRQFLLERIEIENAYLRIDHGDDTPLRIASIDIGARQATTATDEPSTTLPFGVRFIYITDSVIDYGAASDRTLIRLTDTQVNHLVMYQPTSYTWLRIEGEIEDGNFSAESTFRPFLQNEETKILVSANALPLRRLNSFTQPAVTFNSGALSLTSELTLGPTSGEDWQLHHKGDMTAHATSAKIANDFYQARDLHWQGHATIGGGANGARYLLSGMLTGDAIRLTPKNNPDTLFSADRILLDEITISNDELIPITKLTASGITIKTRTAEGETTAADIPQFVSQDIRINKNGAINTGASDFSKMAVNVHIAKTGQSNWSSLMGKRPATPVIETREITKKEPAAPFQLQVARLQVTDSRIIIADERTATVYRQNLNIDNLRFQPLVFDKDPSNSNFHIKAHMGEFTELLFSGSVDLANPKRLTKLKTEAHALELPSLTAYSEEYYGHSINTGQTNLHVALLIENEEITGEAKITIQKLSIERKNEEKARNLDNLLSLPATTTIAILKDKNDDIRLVIPFSGNLSQPEIKLRNVIADATGRAVRTATLTYLKYTMQPFGTALTLVDLARHLSGQIKFDPIVFQIGSAKLRQANLQYLNKLSELLNERPKLRLQFCAYTTPRDDEHLTKSRESKSERETDDLQTKLTQEALLALGNERAAAIKRYLIRERDISPDRLLECKTRFDEDNAAVPRVEILM